MVTLDIDGVFVDISQVENAFLVERGKRHPLPSSLASAEQYLVLGRSVWVQPLNELIAYKRRIGRLTDVADLERLQQMA